MRKIQSILLLVILGVTLFPWHLVCTTHPFGEEHHHDHNGPSPCELRATAIAESNGPLFLPPMDCEQHVLKIGKYQSPQTEKFFPTLQTLAILTVLFDLPYVFNLHEQPFILPAEPKCRSATLIASCPTRGSPLI